MSHPVRVLHVVNSLEPGGMENGVVNVANLLDENGFKISICCLGVRGSFAERLKAGIDVSALEKGAGFKWNTVKRLDAVIRESGPDVLHTHNLGPLIYTALASRWGGAVPVLHGEHIQFTAAEKTGKRLLQRRVFYTACKAVHTVSEMQRQELASMKLGPRRLLAVINGVDFSKFRPTGERTALREALGVPARAFVVGMSGRFGPYKGHLPALDAVAALAGDMPDLHFLVAGDGGPSRDAVLSRMKQPDLEGKVHWVGYRSDMERIYPAMDLLMVPSVNEGMSNAVLEAMASGIPVLANDSCGNAEVIRPGLDGRVMDLSTPDRIAAGIREMAKDPSTLARMGACAREHVTGTFSLEAMAASYATLYGEIANRGKSALASASLARD